MEMKIVISKAISAVGYDPVTRKLRIRFKKTKTYNYCRVPEHIYDSLMKSTSKGGYYNDHIRDKYKCY